MARYLISYVNCSKGGVTSVIRGRALANPNDQFDAIFTLDKGGANAFDDLPNVNVRIVHKSQLKLLIQNLVGKYDYEEVAILSMPDIANGLDVGDNSLLVYEIHTSAFAIAEKELQSMDGRLIDEFRVPSEYSAFNVKQLLNRRLAERVKVVPNLIDTRYFRAEGEEANIPEGKIPLIWIGRFDAGKGVQYLCRLLAQLPEQYIAYVIVSLETEPNRITKFLSEANAMGVDERIFFRLNLPQNEIAELMRAARSNNGAFISTSLMESFGYAIAESLACGLPVFAFDLPVLSEHKNWEQMITVSEPGDVAQMALQINK